VPKGFRLAAMGTIPTVRLTLFRNPGRCSQGGLSEVRNAGDELTCHRMSMIHDHLRSISSGTEQRAQSEGGYHLGARGNLMMPQPSSAAVRCERRLTTATSGASGTRGHVAPERAGCGSHLKPPFPHHTAASSRPKLEMLQRGHYSIRDFQFGESDGFVDGGPLA